MAIKLSKRTAEDGRPFYKLDVRGRQLVVPGDIHFNKQNNDALKAATITAVGKADSPILFLQGDSGDMEGLSRFSKDPEKIVKQSSIKKEREAFERWLERWLKIYDEVFIAPGNHDARAHKFIESYPAFAGMGWWWPYGDIFNDPRITLLDVSYRAELDFGTRPRTFIEHGDELKGITGKCPAATVAEMNPGDHTLIFGHTHRAARATHTRYYAGTRVLTTAINVGHLSDTRKQDYATGPNWQLGCLYLDGDELDLRVW